MNQQVDMSQFVEAKSDQLNADDLIGISKILTVTRVTGNDGDQPISIYYEGDNGKPFKPCKTMRRVLLAIWGRYASEYVGRTMKVYRDDKVTFGGLEVGGIRISHMSHLDKETVVVVMKSKGKKAGIKVLPLKDAPQQAQAQAQDGPSKWADGYISAVNRAETAEQLNKFANDKAAKLAELETKRPELHRACVEALEAKRASFAPAGDDNWDDDPAPNAHHGEQYNDTPEEAARAEETIAETEGEPPYLAKVRDLRAALASAKTLKAVEQLDREWCNALRNEVEEADVGLMQSVERDIGNRRRELRADG